MSLLNKHSTRKLIIVVILFLICIALLGKLYIDYQIELEKEYVLVKDFLSWDGKYSYSLNLEDSQSPPHYTQLFIHGVDYITLRIYNYNDDKYERYRAKVTIDEDEIKALLTK